MTTGLSVHGGRLHVYARQLPSAMDKTVAHDVFFSAAQLLEEIAEARLMPPMPSRPPPPATPEPAEPNWQQVAMQEYQVPASTRTWFHNASDEDYFIVATGGAASEDGGWTKYISPEGVCWWANNQNMRFFFCMTDSIVANIEASAL